MELFRRQRRTLEIQYDFRYIARSKVFIDFLKLNLVAYSIHVYDINRSAIISQSNARTNKIAYLLHCYQI